MKLNGLFRKVAGSIVILFAVVNIGRVILMHGLSFTNKGALVAAFIIIGVCGIKLLTIKK